MGTPAHHNPLYAFQTNHALLKSQLTTAALNFNDTRQSLPLPPGNVRTPCVARSVDGVVRGQRPASFPKRARPVRPNLNSAATNEELASIMRRHSPGGLLDTTSATKRERSSSQRLEADLPIEDPPSGRPAATQGCPFAAGIGKGRGLRSGEARPCGTLRNGACADVFHPRAPPLPIVPFQGLRPQQLLTVCNRAKRSHNLSKQSHTRRLPLVQQQQLRPPVHEVVLLVPQAQHRGGRPLQPQPPQPRAPVDLDLLPVDVHVERHQQYQRHAGGRPLDDEHHGDAPDAAEQGCEPVEVLECRAPVRRPEHGQDAGGEVEAAVAGQEADGEQRRDQVQRADHARDEGEDGGGQQRPVRLLPLRAHGGEEVQEGDGAVGGDGLCHNTRDT